MSPKNNPSNAAETTSTRVDTHEAGETVLTLSTNADRQRLRAELLRLIVKNEAFRKRNRQAANFQDATTTDGSAHSSTEAAEA